jgi:ferritin-like metal-binding protein YciE
MADLTKRDEKLVQYLKEAYGKERELETALEAHIGMTKRRAYKKRLQQHLKETRNHARIVERRIKKLGGDGGGLGELAGRAIATAKGPFHALRGTSDEEQQLKNAKSEYSEEAEEIATYNAIEALAEALGDSETAKLARQIRREEERMASFLEKQIPVLTRAVASAEVPASERKHPARGRTQSAQRRRSRSRRGRGSRSAARRSPTRRS